MRWRSRAGLLYIDLYSFMPVAPDVSLKRIEKVKFEDGSVAEMAGIDRNLSLSRLRTSLSSTLWACILPRSSSSRRELGTKRKEEQL